MFLSFREGDLLDSKCQVIAHQTNCMGVMGSGVAKAIKNKWPYVYEKYKESVDVLNKQTLSGCLLVPCSEDVNEDKYVANLFGQYYYNGYLSIEELIRESWDKSPEIINTDNGPVAVRFTNYEALYRSLCGLKEKMIGYKLDSVSFPYNLGCGRGGGDWNIVLSMIKSVFNDTNFVVEICKL